MISIREEITIATPPDELWTMLADPLIFSPAPPFLEPPQADAAGLFGCRRERRVQGLHELNQIGLPQLGIEMAEMAVGIGSGWD